MIKYSVTLTAQKEFTTAVGSANTTAAIVWNGNHLIFILFML